ncbi:hypothetical protein [Mycolicibacterium setense]|uniref:hypothetical protein n=1 Tax=Mycolicibacterium setense TaxID=431269 RepID=UPI00103CCC1E|nr:hypothetical protein [Mycolicibacterium setense]MCV7114017.1 hypothetical protein [Mycolicibacterium setense]
MVGIAVTGTVVGWPVVWTRLTAWWTPGWGNLFTVGVATLAVMVSARHNGRTLRRAGEQFKQARRDTRNDKLRVEIAALLGAVSERLPRDKVFRARMAETVPPDTSSVGLVKNWLKNANSVMEETVGDVYKRIAMHAFVILTLTNDPAITEPVKQLEQITAEEVADMREFTNKGVKAKDLSGYLQLAGNLGTALLRGIPRQSEIDRATKELRDYCLSHFPQLEQ